VEILDQAIAVYREARDRHLEGKALIKKATALGYVGRYQEATRIVRRGLSRIDFLEEPHLLVASSPPCCCSARRPTRRRSPWGCSKESRAIFNSRGKIRSCASTRRSRTSEDGGPEGRDEAF
jgi:hypothetical protein